MPLLDVRVSTKPKDMFYSGFWKFISYRLGEALQSFDAQGQFELIPINVTNLRGQIFGEYYALNVLHEVDCIDKGRSVLDERSGLKQFTSLLLDESKIRPSDHIFKLKSFLGRGDVMVSNEVAELLEKERFKGVGLYSPDEWVMPVLPF